MPGVGSGRSSAATYGPDGAVPGGSRVFLDACVLFPAMTRSLILSLAAEGLFTPFWSARVLEEWRRAIARQHGAEAAADAERAAERMTDRFPNGLVPEAPDLEATIDLPDSADAHVLATTVAGRAEVLLTFNLRDFPARVLNSHEIVARHPDGFLWELLGHAPHPVRKITGGVLATFDIAPDRQRAALKRARLSRFGKAFQGEDR